MISHECADENCASWVANKRWVNGKKVIVTGCLSQKHASELKEAIPEICAVVGTTDFSKIAEIVEKVEIPKAEEIGTSLGDLFKNIKL